MDENGRKHRDYTMVNRVVVKSSIGNEWPGMADTSNISIKNTASVDTNIHEPCFACCPNKNRRGRCLGCCLGHIR